MIAFSLSVSSRAGVRVGFLLPLGPRREDPLPLLDVEGDLLGWAGDLERVWELCLRLAPLEVVLDWLLVGRPRDPERFRRGRPVRFSCMLRPRRALSGRLGSLLLSGNHLAAISWSVVGLSTSSPLFLLRVMIIASRSLLQCFMYYVLC